MTNSEESYFLYLIFFRVCATQFLTQTIKSCQLPKERKKIDVTDILIYFQLITLHYPFRSLKNSKIKI